MKTFSLPDGMDESQAEALRDSLTLHSADLRARCASARKNPKAAPAVPDDVIQACAVLAAECDELADLLGCESPVPALLAREQSLVQAVARAKEAPARLKGRPSFTERLQAETQQTSAAPLEPQDKSLPFSQRLAAEKAQHSAPVADPPEASNKMLSFTERMKLCKGVAAVLLLSVATAFAGGPYGFSVCDGGTNNVASLSTNTVNSGYPAALDNYTNCFLVCSGVAQMSGASPTLGPATFCFSKGDGSLFETVPSVLMELPITATNTTLAAATNIHMGAAPKLKLVEVRHAGTNCYVTNLTVQWSTKSPGVVILNK